MQNVRIQPEAFDTGAEINAFRASRTDVGALCAFSGYVRDFGSIGKLTQLHLEHFPAMAQKQLTTLHHEAIDRFALYDALIIHRFGTLDIGAEIVLVATLASHREAAFEASQFIMDTLKTTAPFWKKEINATTHAWVDTKASDIAATDHWKKD